MISLPPFNASLTKKEDATYAKMHQPWHQWLSLMFPFWQRAQNVGLYDYLQPSTGFSYQSLDYTEQLILEPAGVLANGSVALPANPTDGLIFSIISTKNITAFTVTSSATIAGTAVTALTASVAVAYRYRAANTSWYRTQ